MGRRPLTTTLPARIVQLSGEPRRDVVNQLYRWSRAGKVIPLRRGMYALADRYRRVPVPPATLANALCFPSYLSGLWALGFYGLIPEAVPVYTSVTTRGTSKFDNAYGMFRYTGDQAGARLFFRLRPVTYTGAADPWLLIPGLFVVVAVLAFNFLGDGLRDAADPYK